MYPKDKMSCKKCEIDFNNHMVYGSVYIVLNLLCVNYVRKKMNSGIGVTDEYNAWHKRKEIQLYNQRYWVETMQSSSDL